MILARHTDHMVFVPWEELTSDDWYMAQLRKRLLWGHCLKSRHQAHFIGSLSWERKRAHAFCRSLQPMSSILDCSSDISGSELCLSPLLRAQGGLLALSFLLPRMLLRDEQKNAREFVPKHPVSFAASCCCCVMIKTRN